VGEPVADPVDPEGVDARVATTGAATACNAASGSGWAAAAGAGVAWVSPWSAGLELTSGVGAAATAVGAGDDAWLVTAAPAEGEELCGAAWASPLGAGLEPTAGVGAAAMAVVAGDEAWLVTAAFADREASCGAAKSILASVSPWGARLGPAAAAASGRDAVCTVWLATDWSAGMAASCDARALTGALALTVGVARTVTAPDMSALLTSARVNVVVVDEG
jgi:hypothetical protein